MPFWSFALAFAEQLLVPFVHHGERRLVAGQQFYRFALCGTGCCAPRHSGSTGLPRCTSASSSRAAAAPLHQGVDVAACHGDGQKAPRPSVRSSARPHRRAPQTSHSPLYRPVPSGAAGLVRGGENALFRALFAVFLLQNAAEHAEGQRRLCGGAGFEMMFTEISLPSHKAMTLCR